MISVMLPPVRLNVCQKFLWRQPMLFVAEHLPDAIGNGLKSRHGGGNARGRKAITVWAFRNGFIEKLHAGMHSELLEKPDLSRITDAEMKQLNIEMSTHIAEILTLLDNDPEEYERRIEYFFQYCRHWEK